MKRILTGVCLAAAVAVGSLADAAFIIEPNGTASGNFSLGGDTTAVSGPSTPGSAVGNSSAGSAFGGNGAAIPDTYLYTYTPGVDGDNVAIAAGTALNDDGDVAQSLAAGITGVYKVYATWPRTENVSGGATRYALGLSDGDGSLFDITVDQNEDGIVQPDFPLGTDGNQRGGEWEFLGQVFLDASTTYVLTQQPSVANSFVSMRSAGVLFVPVPEPASAVVALLGVAGLALRRRG